VLAAAILPFALALGIDFFVGGEFLFGRTQGIIAGAIAFATAILFWYGLELVHRQKHSQEIEKERRSSVEQQQKQRNGTELKDKIDQVLTEVRVARTTR
jgi:high-affinity Fe2+/Pb2+ permease